MAYYYRTPSSKDWRPLAVSVDDNWQPLAIDAASNQLYVLKKYNGRMALFAETLGNSTTEQLVGQNSNVDIDDVVRVGRAQKVIGYTFAEETRHAVYFDPEFKRLSAALSKAIPNLPIVDFVDASADGNKLLIFAGSDRIRAATMSSTATTKSLNEALLAGRSSRGAVLARQQSVVILRRSASRIPAYLTLPPAKRGKNLPAVVLPHGGPSARDEWGFDWLAAIPGRARICGNPAQLSRLGRLSATSGKGERVQGLADGDRRRQRIGPVSGAQGIADPQRMAIVGWSYGGYAALQSVAVDPLLYKARWRSRRSRISAMLKTEAGAFYQLRARQRTSSEPVLTSLKVAAAPRFGDQSAGAAIPRRHGSECQYRASARRWRQRSKAPGRPRRIRARSRGSTTSSTTAMRGSRC